MSWLIRDMGRFGMRDDGIVFVIDDDLAVRGAVCTLLHSVQLSVTACATAQEFLEAYDPSRAACLVLDVRLPGMSGLELQEHLRAQAVPPPIIIITGHADVPMAVQAMRNGAIDFLEKPVRQQILLDRVFDGLSHDAEARLRHAELAALEARVRLLTAREREVMGHVVTGLPNKAIAARLGVTPKAIEAFRARVMRKMGAHSLAELVRMSVALETGLNTPLIHHTPGRDSQSKTAVGVWAESSDRVLASCD